MKQLYTAIGLGVLLASSGLTQAQINFGAVGDSLTDEYLQVPNAASTDLAANSWFEMLADLRGSDFNFGEFNAAPNYWPDRRDSGYEFNWAKAGGAASYNTVLNIDFGVAAGQPLGAIVSTISLDDPLFDGGSYVGDQAIGLAGQIANDEVQVAFVGGGSNDFFYRTTLFDINEERYEDPNADPDAEVADIASSILANVDTLLAAGAASTSGDVELLLALLPPGTAAEGAESQEIIDAINAVNDILIAGAAERGVATVDMFGFSLDTDRTNPDGSVNIGNLVIAQDSIATEDDLSPEGEGLCNSFGECALPSHALNFVAEDGIHPNTAIQGLIANQVIDALNTNYGYNVALLTDAEILSLTGVSEVPVPPAMALFVSAIGLLFGGKRLRK